MFFGKIPVINRLDFSSLDFFDIAAVADPFRAQRRQTARNIDIYVRIAPRAARVVNADRFVDFNFAIHRLRRRERDLAKRHAKIDMLFAGDVHFTRIRQLTIAHRVYRVLGFTHKKIQVLPQIPSVPICTDSKEQNLRKSADVS